MRLFTCFCAALNADNVEGRWPRYLAGAIVHEATSENFRVVDPTFATTAKFSRWNDCRVIFGAENCVNYFDHRECKALVNLLKNDLFRKFVKKHLLNENICYIFHNFVHSNSR
jgi:hypothetical protein